jgi:putative oxidoreductase
LQRLFSTFAGGWPGFGLLLQRILVAVLLVRFGVVGASGVFISLSNTPQIIGVCAGIFLLIGLWTPITGTVIVVIELWMVIIHLNDPWIPIILATLSGTSAMIGPGAWSMDARLYGRKHIGR